MSRPHGLGPVSETVLSLLLSAAGETVEVADVAEAIYGSRTTPAQGAARQIVKTLRGALASVQIEVVYGRGWRVARPYTITDRRALSVREEALLSLLLAAGGEWVPSRALCPLVGHIDGVRKAMGRLRTKLPPGAVVANSCRGYRYRETSTGRRWSRAEDATLRRLAGRMGVAALARAISTEHGTGRTGDAVRGRARALGLTLWDERWTCGDVARALGVYSMTACRWIWAGEIAAERDGTRAGRGAGTWRTDRESVRAFVLANPDRLDPSRVRDPEFRTLVQRRYRRSA